jgi:prevent-host-death family protein
MQMLSLTYVRANHADTQREAETAQEPVVISRRGQPAGVLMSWSQYRRLAAEHGGFAARLQRWRAEHVGTEDGEDPFAGVRDANPGRGVDWPL